MKSALFAIALLFVIVAIAKEPAKWVPLGSSQGVSLSVRNFKVVTPGDRFTYEQKLEYTPGTIQFNGQNVTSAEATILVSCTLRHAKFQTDSIYSGIRIIAKDILSKDSKMRPVPDSSPLNVVITAVCDVADKLKPPEKITNVSGTV